MMNEKVFWDFSYGVYIASTMDQGRPVGCIANSAMQVTAMPASIAVSINKLNYTHDKIKETGKFSMTILSEKTPAKTIGLFGFQSSAKTDKFASVPYELVEGVPVVKDEACAYAVCEVVGTMEYETHTVFLGRVIAADKLDAEAKPMTYDYYHKVIKGKAPKTAPTYLASEDPLLKLKKNEEKKKVKQWKCTVCGYIFDGPDIPNDFICPLCHKDITYFEKVYES